MGGSEMIALLEGAAKAGAQDDGGSVLPPEILLAGSIGALVVFCLGVIKDLIIAFVLRRREQKGLLRIVRPEVVANLGILGDLDNDLPRWFDEPDLSKGAPGRRLRRTAWDSARVRLSQLLPGGEFQDLAVYYARVQEFNDLLYEHTTPSRDQRKIRERMHELSQMNERLMQDMVKWLSVRERPLMDQLLKTPGIASGSFRDDQEDKTKTGA